VQRNVQSSTDNYAMYLQIKKRKVLIIVMSANKDGKYIVVLNHLLGESSTLLMISPQLLSNA
jgi:hypothetical protein